MQPDPRYQQSQQVMRPVQIPPPAKDIQRAQPHLDDIERVANVASAVGTVLALGVAFARAFSGRH